MINPFVGAFRSTISPFRRASRTEYAISMFLYQIALLIGFSILLILAQLVSTTLFDIVMGGYVIAYTLFIVFLTKNRLNDCDYSGWWMLVPFVSLVILFVPGTEGPNRWGYNNVNS